ncbi:immune inhibitor A, partial [candidate division WOR-3 bacterium]|nr:immune inhibitor A [candidate division WOR-3 bacterium]
MSLFLLLLLSSFSEGKWVSFVKGVANPVKTHIVAPSFSDNFVDITLDDYGLEWRTAKTDFMKNSTGEEFALLTLRDYAYTGEIGKPKLPMVTGVIEIPYGAELEITIEETDYKEVSLKSIGIEKRIMPALESVPKTMGAVAEFVLDEKTYSTDAYYPDKIADVYVHKGTARGHKLATVEFFPIHYNPVKKTIRFYNHIKLNVRFIGGDVSRTVESISKNYSRDWEQFIKKMVLNYDFGKKAVAPLPIYYDIFYNGSSDTVANKIALWKMLKGYNVRMWNVAGWTASQINDTIRLQTPIATYLLLIGDPNSSTIPIPPWGNGVSSGDQTDLYYAETDESGYLPDLFYGRVSARTVAEADTAITKLIRYEKADFGSAGYDWLKRACLIAGYDPGGYQPVGIATNAYCMDNCLIPNGYTVDTLIYASGEQEGRVVNEINSGVAWCVYTAHGSRTSWAVGYSGSFTVNELRTETNNQDMYTFPAGHCCLSGDFEYSQDCFGETWPKIGNRGGISYFGSVPSTYWDEDDWLQRRYFDAIYTDSISGRLYEAGRFTQWGLYWIENNTSTSRKQYYFEAYHVFNDPSMDFWTDIPGTLNVAHAPMAVPGSQNFTVTVSDNSMLPVENALVCLWIPSENPDLHKAGYTNSSGTATINISPVSAGETMFVTVTKHNFFPVTDTVLVIVPASWTISPDSVEINTPTDVTVSVRDSSNNDYPGVEIHIFGYGVNLYDTTDVSGQAVINVNAPYGENLLVVGRDTAETYNLFTDTLPVYGGLDFTTWSINAECDTLNVTGLLVPKFIGRIYSNASPGDYTLYAKGCGVDTSASTTGNTNEIFLTPSSSGYIEATIGKSGYNIASSQIQVKKVKGLLSGYVIDSTSGDSIANVLIKGYNHGADTTSSPAVFEVTSDSSGFYGLTDSVYSDYYDVYLKLFGYIPADTMILVKFGANNKNFYIEPAPNGIVYGRVYDTNSGSGLTGTIRVYRTDNDSLYTTVYSDSLNNGNYEVILPYFDYKFKVTAYHYSPITRLVDVNSDSVNEDFKMTPTEGNILVIDDYDGSKDDYVWEKLSDKKKNEILNSKGDVKLNTSANKFYNWLTELGYAVDTTSSASAVGMDWSSYDAVVISSGNDLNPLRASGIQNKITAWYDGGGKLLIEGGELGYDMQASYPTFATHVLHINDWNSDNAGSLTLQNPSHPVASIPNPLPSTIGINYSTYADEDALVLESDATLIYGTNSYPQDAGVLAYDNNLSPEAGQVVFYAFNMDKIDTLIAKKLVENSMAYLLAQEVGPNCSIYGHIESMGTPNDGGTVVTATDGSKYTATDTTDLGGNYNISLYSGTYTLYITREGFHDTTITNVNVPSGGNIQVNADIYPLVAIYQEDFEDSSGGYTNTGDWQWGNPTSGPGNAHSGSKLWATNLSGNYTSSSNAMLTSPIIDLTGVGEAEFIYYQWYNIEKGGSNYDGGNVKISVDGGSFNILSNVNPAYTGTISSYNAGIPGELGYTGNSGGWQKVTADLTAYIGHTIQLRWHFGSDGAVQYPGWYVDDVFVGYTDYSAGVEAHRPYKLSVKVSAIARKNVVVDLALPKAGRVEMKVLDITGRVIKSRDMVRQAGYYTDRINLKRSG